MTRVHEKDLLMIKQMKLLIALIIGTCLCSPILGQPTRMAVGDLTITFPKAPEIEESATFKIYIIKDSSYAITVGITNMPEKFSVSAGELDKFYKGWINGALAAATNPEVLDERPVQIGKYVGKKIKYTKDIEDLEKAVVTKQVVLIGRTVYVLDFWNFPDDDQSYLETEFFSSVVVTAPE